MSRSPSQVLKSDDLVDVGTVCTGLAVTVDNVYAKPEHPDNHFLVKGEAIYKASYAEDSAPLWLHHSLAKIVADAASYLQSLNQEYSIALKDGFRPMEAQKAMELSMLETYAGKTIPATLVSQPGQGAHPKGRRLILCCLRMALK